MNLGNLMIQSDPDCLSLFFPLYGLIRIDRIKPELILALVTSFRHWTSERDYLNRDVTLFLCAYIYMF